MACVAQPRGSCWQVQNVAGGAALAAAGANGPTPHTQLGYPKSAGVLRRGWQRLNRRRDLPLQPSCAPPLTATALERQHAPCDAVLARHAFEHSQGHAHLLGGLLSGHVEPAGRKGRAVGCGRGGARRCCGSRAARASGGGASRSCGRELQATLPARSRARVR